MYIHGYIGGILGDDYVAIKIPKELADEMDKYIGKLGFRSRAELAKESIRRLLSSLYNLKTTSELEVPVLE